MTELETPLHYVDSKFFSDQPQDGQSYPFMLLPVFHFDRGIALFSEKTISAAPFIPLMVADIYYYYLFSEQNSAMDIKKFEDYLGELYHFVFPSTPAPRLIHRYLFQKMVFGLLKDAYWRLKQLSNSPDSVPRTMRSRLGLFRNWDTLFLKDTIFEFSGLLKFETDSGQTIACQAMFCKLDLGRSHRKFSAKDFLALVVELIPEYFTIYAVRQLADLYRQGALVSGNYLEYICKRLFIRSGCPPGVLSAICNLYRYKRLGGKRARLPESGKIFHVKLNHRGITG